MHHIFPVLTDCVPAATIACYVCILAAFTTWEGGQMEDESNGLSVEQQEATWTESNTTSWTDLKS